MIHFVGIGAVALYLATALLFLLGVVLRQDSLNRIGVKLFFSGFALHTIAVFMLVNSHRVIPVENRSDYHFLISWVLALAYTVMARRIHYPVIGAFVAPAVSLFLVSSSIMVHRAGVFPIRGDVLLFSLHVFPAILAEVSLVLAFIAGAVFLIQERRLKLKAIDSFSIKGPDLNMLGNLRQRFVMVGFVTMTLAVISGSVWGVSQALPVLRGDLLQWSALLAWIIMALLLHLRVARGFSAHRMSQLTVLFAGVFFISFFLLMIIGGDGFHQRDIS